MPTRRRSALPLLALALSLFAILAAAGEPKPARIVSTTPSVTGILLAMDAPLVASAATTPSRLTDAKGFFSQWAKVADQRGVEVLYRNLRFDIEAVIARIRTCWSPPPPAPTAPRHTVRSWRRRAYRRWWSTTRNTAGRNWLPSWAGTPAWNARRRPPSSASTPTPPKSPRPSRRRRARSVWSATTSPAAIPSAARPAQTRLLEALGFQVAELPEALAGKVTRASDFQFISRENLPAAIAGDSVFLLGASDDDVQAFLADPVLANLSAVREKRVYALGPSSFRIDYYSGRQMIDNVARHFR